MSLDAGARLGPYEIVAPLGRGGMGEVYRARDTRLDRTVAIKILPPALAVDSELRARFEREARAISSLQHPNICALFDVGDARLDDTTRIQFLVLEYLEGETLADRLARGPALPVGEALRLAIEICDALAQAHRLGIIHRDLKPANVFLVRSARNAAPTAKLLDFGLAKTASPVVVTTGLSMLPTTPPSLTAQGTILGTFQYMAPEQIEGTEADARSDIFAFGAVLFEMLAGRPAFQGRTRATLLGSILKDDPPAVSSVQPGAGEALDRVVATCLAKDPDDRWQTTRDLLRELRWVADRQSTAATPAAAPMSTAARMWWTGGAVVALIAAAVAGFAAGAFRNVPAAEESLRFTIAPPPSGSFTTPPGGGTGVAPQLAVSPDGRHVVFVAQVERGFHLWVRALNSVEARPIPGTEGAAFPFWAPDNRTIGFFANGKLKKVTIDGGPVFVLCDAPQGRGGAWNRDNVIIFTPSTSGGLQRVSAGGGTPVDISTLDSEYGESNHRFPVFLPDGRHYLYTAVVGTCCPPTKPARVKIAALDNSQATTLLDIESSVRYSLGHLLFNRDGTLMAQPFDPSSRVLSGDAVSVIEGVSSEGSRYASFSISDAGLMVHAQGTMLPMGTLTWFDRSGKPQGAIGDADASLNLDLSPDDTTVAAAFANAIDANREIWLFDAKTGAPTRFTFSPGQDHAPVWSPDSRQLAFMNITASIPSIRRKLVRDVQDDMVMFDGPAGAAILTPSDWSPDGRHLLYVQSLVGPGSSSDIWVLPLFGDRTPYAYINSPLPETDATFSPDGRWVAYQLTENGEPHIYVQPFPATGARFQISRRSGAKPVWRADGKELFYLELTGLVMSVAVDTAGVFQSDVPQALFPFPSLSFGAVGRQFDVTRDGQRFILNVRQQGTSSRPFIVSTNWRAGIG